MTTFHEAARDIPVAAEADVVVAGGGPGGVMAALAAARGGAEVLLIERLGFLGGMATAGLMTSFNGFRNERRPNHVQTVRGLAQELVDRLIDAAGACGCTAHGNFGRLGKGECPYAVSFDPEVLKQVILEMLDEAGVRLMLHTAFCAAPAGGRTVRAAVVENKSGRQAVTGKVYVDATGDGDLAARAGARFELARRAGERIMPMTLMYRVTGMPAPGPDERRLWCNDLTTRWGPAVGGAHGSDAADLTKAEIAARRALAEHVAKLRGQFGGVRLVDSAAIIGVREGRRIAGLYMLSEDDCLSGRAFADSVAVSSNPVPGWYGQRRFLEHLGFEVPYRCLVPADLDNVLLAGRCISACQPAFQSARSMAPAMAISQAAGAAAAMCVAAGRRPADLDVAALQARLEADGAVVRVPPDERAKGE